VPENGTGLYQCVDHVDWRFCSKFSEESALVYRALPSPSPTHPVQSISIDPKFVISVRIAASTQNLGPCVD
jgi:hypothetical protein